MEQLDALNIAGNTLDQIPGNAFRALGSLSSLALERNKIAFVHPQAFEGLQGKLLA